MVRRGSSRWHLVGLVVVTAVLGACSDGGGSDDDGLVDPDVPVTLPPADEVDPGFGYLVIDGEPTLLFVRTCELEPALDPATGVTTELLVDLDDQISRAVSLTRSSFDADLLTTSDEILVADDDVIVLDSTRTDRSGTILDLRAPGALEPLFEVDGDVVSASGVFGPPGSQAGDAGVLEGSLILRCP